MSDSSPLQIEIENDVATVRARPGCAPVYGIGFIAIASLLAFVLLGGLDNLDQVSWLFYASAWAIGAALFFAGLLVLQASRYSIARFQGQSQLIEIIHWKGVRRHRTIRWDEVMIVATTALTNKNGAPEFGLALLLKNGDKLSLTPRSYPEGEACDNAARALNRFMHES